MKKPNAQSKLYYWNHCLKTLASRSKLTQEIIDIAQEDIGDVKIKIETSISHVSLQLKKKPNTKAKTKPTPAKLKLVA